MPSPRLRREMERIYAFHEYSSKSHTFSNTTLLSIIEDSATYKTALSFDKGDIGSVPTGGKKVVDIYCEIARKVFIDQPGSKYTKDDLEELKDIICNQMTAYVIRHI